MPTLQAIDKEGYYDMANLLPKHTGLPLVVWISVRGNARHDVRVKVSPTANVGKESPVSVAIRPKVRTIGGKLSPEDMTLLTVWIELNRTTIIQYWDGEIDTVDAVEALKPMQQARSDWRDAARKCGLSQRSV